MASGREKEAGGESAVSLVKTKPEIYTTTGGGIVVEDDLLNFLVVKMKTKAQDEIVLLVTSHFPSEWIASSKSVLYDLCPGTTHRNIQHRGEHKDTNNVKSCLALLNELGDKIPRFVSHHPDELLPVSINNIDVSCLLAKIEKMSADLTALKQGMNMQAKASADLCATSENLQRRLTTVEQRSSSKARASSVPQASNAVTEEEGTGSVSDAPAQWLPSGSRSMRTAPTAENTAEGDANVSAAAATWSTVAKRYLGETQALVKQATAAGEEKWHCWND